jgi:putrescine transport system ATP-binding protein
MLRMVKLEKLARRKPDQLSGGQRQRVALARALIKRPKLLLLDEPLGALDKKLREETQFELIKIQESLGITFIVVTHDQDEAMTLATRIGVMKDGVIKQVGEPAQIYEQPNSKFVADFIGSVNLFDAKVDASAPDGVRVIADDLGPVVSPPQNGLTLGQQVWGAVRPERFALTRAEPTNTPNKWRGVVEEVGYIGHMSHYRIRLESGRLIRASQSNRLRDEDPLTWDERIWVALQPPAFRVLTE